MGFWAEAAHAVRSGAEQAIIVRPPLLGLGNIEGASAMSFGDGCVCHVFAIDGYTNDLQAHQVDERYTSEANAIMGLRRGRSSQQLSDKVARLVEFCRQGITSSAEECTIYGGFQSATDGAPEHMWVEWNGHIYDTMTGAPLRRMVANELSRRHPPSERKPFSENKIGKFSAMLTLAQRRNIDSAHPWASEGGGIDQYMPLG